MPLTWTDAYVTAAGPQDDGGVFIELSAADGSFQGMHCFALDQIKKELLATALTSISTGYYCSTLLSDLISNATVLRLYLRRPDAHPRRTVRPTGRIGGPAEPSDA